MIPWRPFHYVLAEGVSVCGRPLLSRYQRLAAMETTLAIARMMGYSLRWGRQ